MFYALRTISGNFKWYVWVCIFFLFSFFFFRAAPVAYGSSLAGVKSELQMLACIIDTETQDLSHVCNLYCSAWKCQILNPLNDARN